MKNFLCLLLLSTSAQAGCLNYLNCADVANHIIGDKQALLPACDSGKCVCIDDVDLEVAVYTDNGDACSLRLDSHKAEIKAVAVEEAQKEEDIKYQALQALIEEKAAEIKAQED